MAVVALENQDRAPVEEKRDISSSISEGGKAAGVQGTL